MEKLVAELLYFGEKHLGLNKRDEIYIRNLIMEKLHLTSIYKGEIDTKAIDELDIPDIYIEKLSKYVLDNNLCEPQLVTNYVCGIMGLLTPPPSEIENTFYNKYKKDKKEAFDYFYNLCVKNNYIQKTAIDKNIAWKANLEDNCIEITINLSKPEKNNKDIAKLLTANTSSNYPECLLCAENEGFCGTATKAPRQNIRTIGLKLDGEDWFLQYSPYGYFNEHCIVINKKHDFMNVDEGTFRKLFDFIDFYPEYIIGSNAMLPIVGGSILNHEHYQGGGHLMPIHFAKDWKVYTDNEYKDVKISTLKWFNSAIRLTGENRKNVENVATKILQNYLNYSDLDADLLAKDDKQHNAITPIARKNNKNYQLDLILRNNRCTEEYPDGIFHVHPEYQNIKKEGIGLIEAMGLFILPGRLKRQTKEIEKILTGEIKYSKDSLPEDMLIHTPMIEELIDNYGIKNSNHDAEKYIEEYINNTCKNILINTAVFKPTEAGQKQFDKFMLNCGFSR